jgi:two-component system sensor histidine kinase TctE
MEVAELVRQQVDETELRLLHVRWTGFDLTRPDDGSVPEWLLPVGAGLLAALLLAGGATLVLRRRVRVATEELTALNMNLEGLVAERTEQLEEHSHRLRRSNAALQRFAEMAAHDLKGPVTAMAGMADILRTVELPEAQHDRVLGRIQAGAHRLGRMLDDMLGDAVGIGTPTVQVTGREFASWLREVTSPELSIIDAELDVAAPPDTIDTDIEVLRRTALNLVGNAAKYAVNERGRTRVEVRLVRRDDVWLLRVDDNGPGIPPSLWGQVFDRGTRLVDDDRGHGLGLAAIRDLVQGAGGAIRLATSDLGGARFVVTLPTAAVPLDSVVDGGVSPARG